MVFSDRISSFRQVDYCECCRKILHLVMGDVYLVGFLMRFICDAPGINDQLPDGII